MFWIYGGGFTYGSSATPIYNGTRLAEHGVVVITFNYRLNVLSGFALPRLSRESEHGSGDYGMLDPDRGVEVGTAQYQAFGGDPGNVTIFGESAGGSAFPLWRSRRWLTGRHLRQAVSRRVRRRITPRVC